MEQQENAKFNKQATPITMTMIMEQAQCFRLRFSDALVRW